MLIATLVRAQRCASVRSVGELARRSTRVGSLLMPRLTQRTFLMRMEKPKQPPKEQDKAKEQPEKKEQKQEPQKGEVGDGEKEGTPETQETQEPQEPQAPQAPEGRPKRPGFWRTLFKKEEVDRPLIYQDDNAIPPKDEKNIFAFQNLYHVDRVVDEEEMKLIEQETRDFWKKFMLVVLFLAGLEVLKRYLTAPIPESIVIQRSQYSLAVAASCIGKHIRQQQQQLQQQQLQLQPQQNAQARKRGAKKGKQQQQLLLPPSPLADIPPGTYDCGTDAFFITPYAIGIADAVGSWRPTGVDPAALATALMKNSKDFIMENITRQKETKEYALVRESPLAIMTKAWHDIEQQKQIVDGESTATIVTLAINEEWSRRGDPMEDPIRLKSATLGDSGFILIRNQQIIGSASTQYQPNSITPAHLKLLPAQLKARMGGFMHHDVSSPSSAVQQLFITQPGDIIVMGSNGLFDNMYPKAILSIVNSMVEEEKKRLNFEDHLLPVESCKKISDRILEKAVEVSEDPKKITPFSDRAKEVLHAAQQRGGKKDDITVIVAAVHPTGVPMVEPFSTTPSDMSVRKAIYEKGLRA